MRRYHSKKDRKPFMACNVHCAEGFRTDRQYGLIYGPYQREDGSFIIDAEAASIEWEACAYCNSVEE